MDYIVKWSPEATEDLESIAEYIAYARSVVSKILNVSRKIPEQPMIGRNVPEIGKKYPIFFNVVWFQKPQEFFLATSSQTP